MSFGISMRPFAIGDSKYTLHFIKRNIMQIWLFAINSLISAITIVSVNVTCGYVANRVARDLKSKKAISGYVMAKPEAI